MDVPRKVIIEESLLSQELDEILSELWDSGEFSPQDFHTIAITALSYAIAQVAYLTVDKQSYVDFTHNLSSMMILQLSQISEGAENPSELH